MMLVEVCVFLPGARHATRIQFDGTCSKCGAPAPAIMSEEVETGKIWLEGPDRCVGCGAQLSDPNAKFQPLTQAQIEGMFGKF